MSSWLTYFVLRRLQSKQTCYVERGSTQIEKKKIKKKWKHMWPSPSHRSCSENGPIGKFRRKTEIFTQLISMCLSFIHSATQWFCSINRRWNRWRICERKIVVALLRSPHCPHRRAQKRPRTFKCECANFNCDLISCEVNCHMNMSWWPIDR